MGCHFLLQGIFPTQGLNPFLQHFLHCRWILLPLRDLVNPYACDWHLSRDEMASCNIGALPGFLASAMKGQRSPFPGIVLHGQPHWPSTSTCNMGPGILQQSWRAGSAPEESTQKLGRGSSWRKAGWDWIGCCLSPRLRWNNAGWSTPRPSPPTHGLAPALLGNWDTLQSWR